MTFFHETGLPTILEAEAKVIRIHCVVAYSWFILGACTGNTCFKSSCDELFKVNPVSLQTGFLERVHCNYSSSI